MMKMYEVKVWVDDGWQRFTTVHKVLADNKVRAGVLAVNYWKRKDSTNIVKLQNVEELGELTEGVLV